MKLDKVSFVIAHLLFGFGFDKILIEEVLDLKYNLTLSGYQIKKGGVFNGS